MCPIYILVSGEIQRYRLEKYHDYYGFVYWKLTVRKTPEHWFTHEGLACGDETDDHWKLFV